MSSVEPPGATGFNANIDDLHKDAEWWAESAQTLLNAADAAEGLTLDPRDFSFFGEIQNPPVGATYRALQNEIVFRLREGAKAFDSVAQALVKSINEYQQNDQKAAEALKKIEAELQVPVELRKDFMPPPNPVRHPGTWLGEGPR